jgi:hypothetical protein
MGGACSAHVAYDQYVDNFGEEILKRRNHLEDLHEDEEIILK